MLEMKTIDGSHAGDPMFRVTEEQGTEQVWLWLGNPAFRLEAELVEPGQVMMVRLLPSVLDAIGRAHARKQFPHQRQPRRCHK